MYEEKFGKVQAFDKKAPLAINLLTVEIAVD